MQYVKIPEERIGVLIGAEGEMKERIEKLTKIRILIDSKTGDVSIDERECDDPLAGVKAAEFVRAVGRGFNPEKAFKLLRDEFYLESLDIRDYVGKKGEHVRRMRGRIIGTDGKTRRIIESLSGTDVSISGNTVSIIGEVIEVGIARTAVDMILSGSEHATVYRFLERKRKEMRLSELGYVEYRQDDEEDEGIDVKDD